jgi:hypothetical protein
MAHVSRRGLLLGAGVVLGGTAVGLRLPVEWRGHGIHPCATWLALPPVEAPVVLHHRPQRILVHHTGTENTTDRSLRHAYSLARFFQDLHMVRQDWGDTGQHFTNTRGGILLEGRHLSLAGLGSGEWMVHGAHCPGQNGVSIGIENEGTYLTEEPPEVQWAALVWLCAQVCLRYGIAPTEIHGHRDFYDDTVCPGDRLYARLPRLREEVADFLP